MALSEAELRERLREVERHLREVPPHHGGGMHDRLQQQRADLQARLARLERLAEQSPRDERKGST